VAAGGVFTDSGVRRGFAALVAVVVAAVFAAVATAASDDVEVTWKEPQDSTRVVKAAVECRVACSVEVKGKLEIPQATNPTTGEMTNRRTAKLRPDSDELDARQEQRFRLRIPREARPALRKALAAEETSLARLKVFTAEANGESGRVRARIELRQRRP
jgi:hypothetical protein